MSAASESRQYRREQQVRQYLMAQPRQSSGAPMYDTAVHVLQDSGLYVSDKRAHDMWCALFDLQMAGVVVVEADGSSCRLATVEELQAKLTGEPVADNPVSLTLAMIGRKDND